LRWPKVNGVEKKSLRSKSRRSPELCTPSRSQSVQSLSPGVKAAGARRLFIVALKLV
jgi:hypothetical protein